jgi:hypothetical protein
MAAKQPWVCDANEAVTVRMGGRSFHPTYTHQVFNPEERIRGYGRDGTHRRHAKV